MSNSLGPTDCSRQVSLFMGFSRSFLRTQKLCWYNLNFKGDGNLISLPLWAGWSLIYVGWYRLANTDGLIVELKKKIANIGITQCAQHIPPINPQSLLPSTFPLAHATPLEWWSVWDCLNNQKCLEICKTR